jgi:hypothetical protein
VSTRSTIVNVTLSPSEIAAEDDWLRSIGLVPPPGGFLLENPFGLPLTGRSFLVPREWHSQTPSFIDSYELIEDLEVLALALREAYAGWEPAEVRGFSWNGLFHEWREFLGRQKGAVAIRDAFDPWKNYLAVQLDNHSGPVIPDGFSKLSSTVTWTEPAEGRILAARDAMGQTIPLDRDARATWRLGCGGLERCCTLSGPFRELKCTNVLDSSGRWLEVRSADIPTNLREQSLRSLSGRAGDSLFYRSLSRDIDYLRVPTLSFGLAPDWPRVANPATLVIDLRGNRGGAANLVLPALERLVGPIGPAFSFGLEIKQSCLSRAFAWGAVLAQLEHAATPLNGRALEIVHDAFAAFSGQTGGEQTPYGTPAWKSRAPAWTYPQHLFQPGSGTPRLVVLVDQDCGSDGELLAFLLASLPGSVVAGPNTAGVAQFARPGYFVLPHTRVRFRVATAMTDLYGDGRALDGVGLESDVLVDPDVVLDERSLIDLVQRLKS